MVVSGIYEHLQATNLILGMKVLVANHSSIGLNKTSYEFISKIER